MFAADSCFLNESEIDIFDFDENFSFSCLKKIEFHKNFHIWKFDISKLAEHILFFEKLMCTQEISGANKFRFQKDRLRAVVSRGGLRFLLGSYLSVNPCKIEFFYGEKGKPNIKENSPFSFNVSHSGNFVLIGFSKFKNTGVDIEQIRLNSDICSIVENYFHKDEIDYFYSYSEKNRGDIFFKLWTLKEAYIKAYGMGIGKSFRDFSIFNENMKSTIKLFSFIPEKNYYGAGVFC